MSKPERTPSDSTSGPEKTPDWNASQYLKFSSERTRPVYDLVSQVLPHLPTSGNPPEIYDLGCGPGNSTSVLASAIPNATITGMDSSPDMLSKARAASIPNTTFVEGDLATFTPDASTDLIFSNAAFHWLRQKSRLPTLVRLLTSLKPGAVLAFQVPDNYNAPTHSLMRTTALEPSQPWSPYFPTTSSTGVGQLADVTRPDLDPVESTGAFYNAFAPHAAVVNMWRTEYMHVVEGHRAIVEWVKSTGLKPFLDRIGEEGVRRRFEERYEELLRGEFESRDDGKVLLPYPRLFVVVVRK